MQKLKQLTFDRRSSTILKTWANLHGPAPEPAREALDSELAAFQRNVTLGNWAAVKTYLAGLPEEEGKAAYRQLLQSLQSPPAVPASGSPAPASPTPAVAMAVSAQEGVPVQARPAQVAQQPEPNVFAAEDIVGLAGAAPRSLDKDATAALGAILRQALAGGLAVEQVVVRMKAESARPGGALTKRQAAQLLVTADQAAAAGDFLPGLDQATADKDAEALNLLARHFLALHAKEQKATHLEQAWRATQAALATGAGHRAEQEEALKRAVELAPQIQEALGKTWLEQSFTSRPERGMDILATIGSLAAQGMQTQPMNATERLKTVQLQKTAVEALLRATPARAADWRMTLTLLAGNWLREAELTYQFAPSSNSGPRMQRDPYGNIFYVNDNGSGPMMPPQPNQPAPIPTSDILEARPGEAWLALVDDGLKPHLVTVFARLYLKAGEEEKAFPFIEQLAGSHPEPARELVNEFLRVWTQNHDPNANRGYTNAYMFMYGFERRAESIPLTRSKQERNLEELAGWVRRLRRLPIRDPDEDLLAKAFTSSHSNAEVYRLDAIEKVFGPIGSLKPRTLSGLVQQMRENLAGVWRDPAVQKDKKTNRKTRDIQAEVLRGYDLAQTVTEDALKKFPDDWSLHLARAALHLDEAYYRQELARYPEFSRRRDEAFAEFQQAARLYAARVKGLGEEEQSTKVYEQWFYASLGACDLEHVTEDKLPDLKQPALIRAAILGLPGELAERHLGRFANTLFTRLSAVKPAVKFRYLGGGFEIAGDHKEAREARKVYDYYKDLVQEIKLETVLDGSDVVGHDQPFGVFVNLRHTGQIERESGGFGRYLQNQNSGYFSYNYGRPTADYRDKFQAAVTEALQEHFEVLSVTFQNENVNSRATAEYGWRVTPYAYLLLKARGPEVDKLPSLRMDLDFLDTSGYVILPFASPALPLDARPKEAPSRPLRQLQVTQTLDERQAGQGKLVLEVKAAGLGLVGRLDQVLTLAPNSFEVVKTDDQGVSVTRFDPESTPTAVTSERTWLITLQPKPGLPHPPEVFPFGTAKAEGTAMIYQRYQDADLVSVGPEVPLEGRYGRRGYGWLWAGVGLAAGLVLLIVLLRRFRKRAPAVRGGVDLPAKLTPFTMLAFLQRVQKTGRLEEAQQAELSGTIQQLERYYFAGEANGDREPDLKQLADRWAGKSR